jgi:ABC-type transport system substrate-binding protein
MGWVADTEDPDNVLHTLLSPENAVLGVARNLSFFRDPVLGELLEAARESQRPLRDVLYARAQERVAQMAPWVPLAHARLTVATRRNLENIRLTSTGHVSHRKVRRRE